MNDMRSKVCPHCGKEIIYKADSSEPKLCSFCGEEFEDGLPGSNQKQNILIVSLIFGIILLIAGIGYMIIQTIKVDNNGTPQLNQPTSSKILTPEPIDWSQARNHLGERKSVCGQVAGTNHASTIKGEPTFLDMGRKYPDPTRFTVLIWGDQRINFSFKPEDFYANKNICVTGLILDHKGSTEIEVQTPSQITVQ